MLLKICDAKIWKPAIYVGIFLSSLKKWISRHPVHDGGSRFSARSSRRALTRNQICSSGVRRVNHTGPSSHARATAPWRGSGVPPIRLETLICWCPSSSASLLLSLSLSFHSINIVNLYGAQRNFRESISRLFCADQPASGERSLQHYIHTSSSFPFKPHRAPPSALLSIRNSFHS